MFQSLKSSQIFPSLFHITESSKQCAQKSNQGQTTELEPESFEFFESLLPSAPDVGYGWDGPGIQNKTSAKQIDLKKIFLCSTRSSEINVAPDINNHASSMDLLRSQIIQNIR